MGILSTLLTETTLTPEESVAGGTYDITTDRLDSRRPDNTRKPELTLRKINRLKKIRAQNKLEALKREDLLGIMYGGGGEDGGGLGPGGF